MKIIMTWNVERKTQSAINMWIDNPNEFCILISSIYFWAEKWNFYRRRR